MPPGHVPIYFCVRQIMINTMNLHLMIVLILSSMVHSSEFHITLQEKVKDSSTIIIAEVIDVAIGDINNEGQETAITLRVEKTLKGDVVKEVKILPRSTSYTVGNTCYSSTAGWSNYGINVGNKYIVYLNTKNGQVGLVHNSNQYMERIYPDKNQVNDVGQVLDTVPYDQKVIEIQKLVSADK